MPQQRDGAKEDLPYCASMWISKSLKRLFISVRSSLTSAFISVGSSSMSAFNSVRSSLMSAFNSVRSSLMSAFNSVRSWLTVLTRSLAHLLQLRYVSGYGRHLRCEIDGRDVLHELRVGSHRGYASRHLFHAVSDLVKASRHGLEVGLREQLVGLSGVLRRVLDVNTLRIRLRHGILLGGYAWVNGHDQSGRGMGRGMGDRRMGARRMYE